MTDDLIASIGKQLNIPKSDENGWICRVVYSIAGQMALASLWDHAEDGSSVSIQHFKSRIEQIFDAYESIYPKTGFPPDKTDLIEEMYSIYETGSFIIPLIKYLQLRLQMEEMTAWSFTEEVHLMRSCL